MTDRIRVLVVEDHPVLAQGLELALGRQGDIHVVAVAHDVAQAGSLEVGGRVDVALVDYHLPDGTGADAARAIRARHPNVAVVVLSADSSDDAMVSSVEAGACGYVVKTEPVAAIVDGVRRAAAGETLLPPATLSRLFALMRERGRRELARPALTDRELEILRRIGQGQDNKSIAGDLRIGLNTVRHHVQSVLEKLQVHSKLEAAARGYELGLIDR
jgi:DNA-binding NarL/FixJ family response regulator